MLVRWRSGTLATGEFCAQLVLLCLATAHITLAVGSSQQDLVASSLLKSSAVAARDTLHQESTNSKSTIFLAENATGLSGLGSQTDASYARKLLSTKKRPRTKKKKAANTYNTYEHSVTDHSNNVYDNPNKKITRKSNAPTYDSTATDEQPASYDEAEALRQHDTLEQQQSVPQLFTNTKHLSKQTSSRYDEESTSRTTSSQPFTGVEPQQVESDPAQVQSRVRDELSNFQLQRSSSFVSQQNSKHKAHAADDTENHVPASDSTRQRDDLADFQLQRSSSLLTKHHSKSIDDDAHGVSTPSTIHSGNVQQTTHLTITHSNTEEQPVHYQVAAQPKEQSANYQVAAHPTKIQADSQAEYVPQATEQRADGQLPNSVHAPGTRPEYTGNRTRSEEVAYKGTLAANAVPALSQIHQYNSPWVSVVSVLVLGLVLAAASFTALRRWHKEQPQVVDISRFTKLSYSRLHPLTPDLPPASLRKVYESQSDSDWDDITTTMRLGRRNRTLSPSSPLLHGVTRSVSVGGSAGRAPGR